jgi:hypothetical protein
MTTAIVALAIMVAAGGLLGWLLFGVFRRRSPIEEWLDREAEARYWRQHGRRR